MTERRGIGITSAQMRAAPANARYIWCNEKLDYPRRLARFIGRTDLLILGPSALECPDARLRQLFIVVDHAARLTEKQKTLLHEIRGRQGKNKS